MQGKSIQVNRGVPVRDVLGRKRLISVADSSLLLNFHVAQNRDENEEDDAAQTTADNQTEPSRENRIGRVPFLTGA
ncbi:hypothetical protein RUM44_000869 [Polyplax serrata]|uniref:Uncharacterized protein n=1 Tax=Polyplax serrata TaxID=468196 RepID=A0ABR1B6B3_POLSC